MLEAIGVEPLRRALTTIRKYLGGMTPTQKLLIGSLVVCGVMVLLFVAVVSSSTSMTVLPTTSAEEQSRYMTLLQGSGITAELRGGKLMVPDGQVTKAWALVFQSGQQPANSALVFENIIKSQNWLNSKELNKQIYQQMLNNALASVISKFDGVKSATVLVDNNEVPGIGQAARPPKASIAIFTQAGKPLAQSTVDAAARMVAGAVQGLDVSRVNVQDGAGRPRKVTDDSELASTTYREISAALEKQLRDKIYNLVRYIDGVVVEVSATAVTEITPVQADLPDDGSSKWWE